MESFVYWISGFIVIFIVVVSFSSCTLVKSSAVDKEIVSSDLCYYLPKGILKVTAKVKIEKFFNKSTKEYLRSNFLSQEFSHVKEIIPDASQLMTLNYRKNILSNDEVTIKVSNKGLLESVKIIAEDRTPTIVEELSKAPAIIFAGADKGLEAQGFIEEEKVIEEFTKVFIVDPEELPGEYNWLIIIEDTDEIDVSFKLEKNGAGKNQMSIAKATEEIKGIYSRPVEVVNFKIIPQETSLKSTNVSEAFFEYLPSTSRVIQYPIKRALFVKKEQSMSFENGMVTENIIKKPSEVEGFISIPINVAKAIISIPAQLVTLKIDNTKKNVELQKELNSLEAEVKKSEKNKELEQLELAQKMAAAEKELLKTTSEIDVLKETMEQADVTKALKNEKSLLELEKSIEQLKKEIEELSKKD